MARPLIEVFNVAVFPEFLPCCHSVYGDIWVYDEDHPERMYKLYERDSEHPELISERGQVLLLTGPDDPLSIPKPVMSIRLFGHKSNNNNDTNNSDEDEDFIISDDCQLETARDEFEEFKWCQIKGHHGFARVYYAAMACGLFAHVRIIISHPRVHRGRPNQSDDNYEPYGTVTAYYDNKFGYRTITDDIPPHYFSTTLVNTCSHNNNDDNEFVPLERDEFGTVNVMLTKRFAAVPAYSNLIVDTNLMDRLTNKPFLLGSFNGLARSGHHTTVFLPNARSDDVVAASGTQLRVVCREPAALLPQPNLNHSPIPFWGERLLEVYSIFVAHNNADKPLSVYGTIGVRTIEGRHCIYDTEPENADIFPEGKGRLAITPPSSVSDVMSCDDEFVINVCLFDAHDDEAFAVQGIVNWNTLCIGEKNKYNKLLCSVIHGYNGHCVVHHTNFSRAVKLQVTCDIKYKKGIRRSDDHVSRVYGTIVSWCDNLDYTFEYHKNYCKRVLFSKSEDDALVLFQDTASNITYEIESSLNDDQCINQDNISTSYVAMPLGGTLFIDVHVYATSSHHQAPAERLKGTVACNMLGDLRMEIQGEEFDILVSGLVFARKKVNP